MAEIAVFEPLRFERLYGVISAATAAAQAETADWYIHVERARDALASLGRVKPPSQTERRHVSQGTLVLEGTPQSLNADFVAQTLLLSDELKVSETYAASLLQEGIRASARWARPPTDVACILYYHERLALYACLKELARAAYTMPLVDDVAVQRTGARVARLLDGITGGAPRIASTEFIKRLLDGIDAHASEASAVRGAMQKMGGARLSDEIQLERIGWAAKLEEELGHVLYLLAIGRRVPPTGAVAAAERLASSPNDHVTIGTLAVLTTLLAILDVAPDGAAHVLAAQSGGMLATTSVLAEDHTFRTSISGVLARQWQNVGLKNALSLQWAVFAAEAPQSEDAEALATAALTGSPVSALEYLLLHVLAFRHGADAALVDAAGESQRVQVSPAFQEYILQQVEHLVQGVTTHFLVTLRRLQRAEEDAAFASLRNARPGASSIPRRYDIEALFDLVALICTGRPDAGLVFWLGPDRRPSRFLLWALDVREHGQQRALLHMLAALAEGEQCAAHTHALLEHDVPGERRLVSWARLFDWISYYVEQLRDKGGVMPPDEMVLLRLFLGVLASVVRYSAAARDSLYVNRTYAPITQLFALYSCGVPVDLKAAVLDALTAFAARPPGGRRAPRIIAEIWQRLDALQAVRPDGSAVYELEQVEAAHYRYPGSVALVRLLQAVLPVSTRGADADALVAASTGQQYAPQAAAAKDSDAYVAFVADRLFLGASARVYDHAGERWLVSATCLAFIEHCISSLDLRLLFGQEPPSARDLAAIARHPGVSLLRRLLTGTNLLTELFFFLHPDPNGAGFEAVNGDYARSPHFAAAVRSALRIIVQVLRVQSVFIDVLVPMWGEAGGALALAAGPASAYMPLERHLLHHHNVVVQMALYANSIDEDIARLGVQALDALAHTPTFDATDRFSTLKQRHTMNRLVGVVEMSEETARVQAGMLTWLGASERVHEPDDASASPVSHVILDMLLAHTRADRTAPNVAHLILGYSLHASRDDDLLAGADERHAVLAAVRTLVAPPDAAGVHAAARDPALTEKCIALLHNLCVHPYSSASTLRYLRSHDFVVNQLSSIALEPAQDAYAVTALAYPGGVRTPVASSSVLALLHTQAHLLALAALELHALALNDQLSRAAALLGVLFGAQVTLPETVSNLRARNSARMLDMLYSLDFEWHDERLSAADSITLITPAALNPARIESESRVFDLHAVADIMLAERERTRAAGVPEEHADWLEQSRLVLQWAAAQNARRAVGFARRDALYAWRQVLDVVLAEAFGSVRVEARTALLLDTLAALFPRLSDGNADDNAGVEMAAGAVLSLLASLRMHCAGVGDSVPTDRILAVLRALVDALLRLGMSAQTRGDLYLALVVLLQLVASPDAAEGLAEQARSVLGASADRLAEIIGRDALDGADVWKTAAFTLLDRLAAFDAAPRRTPLASLLASKGYIRGMASLVRDLDSALQDALSPDPQSLNAQYVYEAALAFLGRVSSSRQGTELLLDAQILDVFARSDFVALRPNVYEASTADGFLPSTAERYRALVMPMLQLLVSMLGHARAFGTDTDSPFAGAPTVVRQAKALVAAHHDAFVALVSAPTLPGASVGDAELAALAVHALRSLPEVHATLHAAVLALADSALAPEAASVYSPHTPAERDAAGVLAPTAGGLLPTLGEQRPTLFDESRHAAAARLVGALAQYLESHSSSLNSANATSTGSGAQAPLTGPVLTPVLHVTRDVPRRGAAPSLGLAVSALDAQIDTLTQLLQGLERVHGVVNDPDSVRADEWDEIARDLVGDDAVAHVSPAHARVLGLRALSERKVSLVEQAVASLDTVELLLVLLVRHVEMFLTTDARARDGHTLAADTGAVLFPVLEEKLCFVALAPSVVPDAAEHTAFLQMASRRLSSMVLRNEQQQ
ncbi:hypothetical protein MCUN1_000357 [Malassezia cuniculi]|uniref:Nucleoporin n=1 Tax=Malassezia cuniculi TaxID=948313 RepID=A0AAF0EQY6_9BASI|nr:hypothetical protein MCUN1_000357 [Malassezia cuniculi]